MADRPASGAERGDKAHWNAREIARRNRQSIGEPLSPVMKTAATARELAYRSKPD